MSNIKGIRSDITPNGQPVELVVELLEDLLKRAKTGEVRAVAVAGVCQNGSVTSAYQHENHIFALLGGLTYLSGRIQIALESA